MGIVGSVIAGVVLACGTKDESPFNENLNNVSNDANGTQTGNTDASGSEFTGSLDGSLPDTGSTVVQTACVDDNDCGDGGVCNLATKTCGCGGVAVNAEVVPPNLLVILDRSCSMTEKVGGKSKWEIAQAAIHSLTTQYKGKIRFGLELFPDISGDSCEQTVPIAVPVGADKETAINDLLFTSLEDKGAGNNFFPNGPCVTNINYAVATSVSQLTDSTRKNFGILLTDGSQYGCAMADAGNSDTYTKTIIANQHTAGIDTFVIGFGGGVDANALNSFALAGGQPNPAAPPDAGANPTPPFYYNAANESELTAALSSIAKKTLSCSLKLASAPPGGDATLINVFYDKKPTPVPAVGEAGTHWTYDAATTSVTFVGADCEALKAGTVSDISVAFGCPGSPVVTLPGAN